MLYVNPSIGDDAASGSQSAPFRTISHALSQAVVGSKIQLAPGTYSADSGEQFPLNIPASVVLIGDEASRGQDYIICGSGTKSTLDGTQEITVWLERNAELRGVTVTNPVARGAGVWLQTGISVLANCTLKDCQREGIRIMGQAQPKVINNLCTGNDAYGIWVLGQVGGEIRQNVCQATGTGLAVSDRASPRLTDNLIKQNRTGMILSQNAHPVLRQNRIERNTGDGLVVTDDARPNLGASDDFGKNILRENGGYDLQNDTSQRLLSIGNQVLLSKIRGLIELMHNQQPAPILDAEIAETDDVPITNSATHIDGIAVDSPADSRAIASDTDDTDNMVDSELSNVETDSEIESTTDSNLTNVDATIDAESSPINTESGDIPDSELTIEVPESTVDFSETSSTEANIQVDNITETSTADADPEVTASADSLIDATVADSVDLDVDLDAELELDNSDAKDASETASESETSSTTSDTTDIGSTAIGLVATDSTATDDTATDSTVTDDTVTDDVDIDSDQSDAELTTDAASELSSAIAADTNDTNLTTDAASELDNTAEADSTEAEAETTIGDGGTKFETETDSVTAAVEGTETPSQSDVPTATLSDIQGHWAAPFIQALVARDIITSFADGTFRPDTHMTRSQFAAWIVQAFDQPLVRQEIQFRDLPPNFWAAGAIAKATRMGFFAGYPGGRFQPNQQLSRVQVIVALVSGLGLAKGSRNILRIYRDRLRISRYANAKVAAATQRQMVVNHPEVNALRPTEAVTRAEVAAFIHQALVVQGRLPAIASADIVQPEKVGLIFTDIQTHEAVDAIQAIAARGWISGYSDGAFRPDASLTRAQYATLIANVFDPPAERPLIEFTDVSNRFWAKAAIAQAYSGGYLSGYPDGTFKPSAYATRLNVVTSLATGLNLPAADLALVTGFADQSEIPAVAKSAIASAIQASIIAAPVNGEKFEPFRNVSRAEAVKMVHQALVQVGRM